MQEADSSEDYQHVQDLGAHLHAQTSSGYSAKKTGLLQRANNYMSSLVKWGKQDVELQTKTGSAAEGPAISVEATPANVPLNEISDGTACVAQQALPVSVTPVAVLDRERVRDSKRSGDATSGDDSSEQSEAAFSSELCPDSRVTITSVSSISSLTGLEALSPGSSRQLSDEWAVVSMQPGTAELSVESALLWCLNPAIYGIRSIGVLPATERARRLVSLCNGDTNAAVVMAAGGEAGGVQRTRIIFEFLIRQVPFVGCPAYILTSTWTHLRAVATIAAIYGHDLESPRTQHEVLWCLLPQEVSREAGGDSGACDGSPVTTTARTVANMLIASAVKRTTGISMVTELFQLGTDLWSTRLPDDDSGFECLSLGPSATARHYFCPDSSFSQWKFFGATLGLLLPWFYRIPTTLLTMLIFACALGFRGRVSFLPGRVRAALPAIISYTIFSFHALIPVLGIANGTWLVLSSQDGQIVERTSVLVLGLMALSAGLKSIPSPHAELLSWIHSEIRQIAIAVGVVLHVLPLMDRTGRYVEILGFWLDYHANSAKSIHFISVIASSTFHHIVLSQLKRREVVLRLLGAERVMVLSLTLFFRGISAAVTPDSLLPFFKQITPHPLFCCLAMTVRRHAVMVGLSLAIAPLLAVWLASTWLSMLAGLSFGIAAISLLWNDWRLNEDYYLSHLRLLFILPGSLSSKSKQVLDNLLLSSGKSALKSVLVQFARNFASRVWVRKLD